MEKEKKIEQMVGDAKFYLRVSMKKENIRFKETIMGLLLLILALLTKQYTAFIAIAFFLLFYFITRGRAAISELETRIEMLEIERATLKEEIELLNKRIEFNNPEQEVVDNIENKKAEFNSKSEELSVLREKVRQLRKLKK